MDEVKNNTIKMMDKFHLVLICDEIGIFDAFTKIKEHLGRWDGIFITLIYVVPNNFVIPLFEREITILEQRFSHNLYKNIQRVKPGIYDSIQEIIEATINSNTNLEMQFLVFGNDEFVDYATGVLEYLKSDTI